MHLETGVKFSTEADLRIHVLSIAASELLRQAIMRHKEYSEEEIIATDKVFVKQKVQ